MQRPPLKTTLGIALVVGLVATALLFWLGDTSDDSPPIDTTSAAEPDAFRPPSGVDESADTPSATTNADEDLAQHAPSREDTRRSGEPKRAARDTPSSSAQRQRDKPDQDPQRSAVPGNEPGPNPTPNATTGDSEDDKPSIDRHAIQDSLREYAPVAKRCYEDLLGEFPEAEGAVVVAFDVTAENGQGRVELAEVSENTDLFDVQLHDCMLEQLGEVTFPAPRADETLRVTYPFNFQSGGE